MRTKYLWQHRDWPNFFWDGDSLLKPLAEARKAQGKILAQAELIGLESEASLIVDEAFATSAIEGESLDRNSIRSSIARRPGLKTAGLPAEQRPIAGLVDMLLDATSKFKEDLSENRLCGWQAALFPSGYSGIQRIEVGRWRSGSDPMYVVSGGIGKEKVHYEAPPASTVPREMAEFLRWWHCPPTDLDGLLRAGIAHFWFVTIHPFDDGNGRVSRAIADMALAQDESSARRLINLSTQILKERDEYYRLLETCQKGSLDITAWLEWFLEMYARSVRGAEGTIGKVKDEAKFWQQLSGVDLNERQRKVVRKMLEAEPQGFEGGMNNRKYVSLTGTSRESAKRDLADLEEKRVIVRNEGGGRSTSYRLKRE